MIPCNLSVTTLINSLKILIVYILDTIICVGLSILTKCVGCFSS